MTTLAQILTVIVLLITYSAIQAKKGDDSLTSSHE